MGLWVWQQCVLHINNHSQNPFFFFFWCVFWARICWQVKLGLHWHLCYNRNLDLHGKRDLPQVLKMLPSCFSFPKSQHKSDECAHWCLCRVWQPLVLCSLAHVRAGREERGERRGEGREERRRRREQKVIFVLSSEHLPSQRGAASVISAFRALGSFANQAHQCFI